ncbi:methyltransferase domain-containing protein [Trichlorobacter ammonificans]|uniref:Malonyl-[acyl-carrier protein] O-methyltransferase n=1 Tax=Trichlorobacter ammonificans TaxID=2916410 RepID=A0ABN8HGS5_9BACT|nr:methyltransferase domain-containing protein [Trichlorobacter ammonificans]CAH2030800.1 Malonyl-[acyl-carrier protein] O-methyltransferase [Trichlorobacter ammonificans]
MPAIDRSRVRHSFQRGASLYDHLTPLQQRVVEQVLHRLPDAPLAAPVLDIGCGTGRLLAGLVQRYPSAPVVGLDLAFAMLRQARPRVGGRALLLQGDAERLPFRGGSFALIVSSSTFQWCDDLDACFREVYRCLRPGGRFSFALFGAGTFQELRECWRDARSAYGIADRVGADGTHRFHTEAQVRAALERQQFGHVVVESLLEREWYPDVAHLLQSVKRIGAGSSRPPAGGGLGWRRVLHRMATYYTERYGTTGGVPASYEVIHGEGRR